MYFLSPEDIEELFFEPMLRSLDFCLEPLAFMISCLRCNLLEAALALEMTRLSRDRNSYLFGCMFSILSKRSALFFSYYLEAC